MFDSIAVIPIVGPFASHAIPFILVLSVIVFIHELGHYLVGRWCGIGIVVFSVGFGPVLWSWRDRRGTTWQVAALPFGGYVRFLEPVVEEDTDEEVSEDPSLEESDSEGDETLELDDVEGDFFDDASVPSRLLTVVAGPFANFALAVFVFAGLATVNGVSTDAPLVGKLHDLPGFEFGLQKGDRIVEINGQEIERFSDIQYVVSQAALSGQSDASSMQNDRVAIEYVVERDGGLIEIAGDDPFAPFLASVEPLSPASRAGLRPGDLILEANSIELRSFADLRDVVLRGGDSPVDMLVYREGDTLLTQVVPALMDREVAAGVYEKRLVIGVRGRLAFEPEIQTPGPIQSLEIGASTVVRVVDMSMDGIYHMFAGNIGIDNLQGPIGIAHISGEVASNGLLDLVWLIGVISVAIGILNLLPIPVLDGGHVVMLIYEAIAGRRPNQRVMGFLTQVGLMALLSLMLFATYNDILRLFAV